MLKASITRVDGLPLGLGVLGRLFHHHLLVDQKFLDFLDLLFDLLHLVYQGRLVVQPNQLTQVDLPVPVDLVDHQGLVGHHFLVYPRMRYNSAY